MQVISQDHFTTEAVYAPGSFTYTKEIVGTRYAFIAIRTLADPQNPDDMKAARMLSDSDRSPASQHWQLRSAVLGPDLAGESARRFEGALCHAQWRRGHHVRHKERS